MEADEIEVDFGDADDVISLEEFAAEDVTPATLAVSPEKEPIKENEQIDVPISAPAPVVAAPLPEKPQPSTRIEAKETPQVNGLLNKPAGLPNKPDFSPSAWGPSKSAALPTPSHSNTSWDRQSVPGSTSRLPYDEDRRAPVRPLHDDSDRGRHHSSRRRSRSLDRERHRDDRARPPSPGLRSARRESPPAPFRRRSRSPFERRRSRSPLPRRRSISPPPPRSSRQRSPSPAFASQRARANRPPTKASEERRRPTDRGNSPPPTGHARRRSPSPLRTQRTAPRSSQTEVIATTLTETSGRPVPRAAAVQDADKVKRASRWDDKNVPTNRTVDMSTPVSGHSDQPSAPLKSTTPHPAHSQDVWNTAAPMSASLKAKAIIDSWNTAEQQKLQAPLPDVWTSAKPILAVQTDVPSDRMAPRTEPARAAEHTDSQLLSAQSDKVSDNRKEARAARILEPQSTTIDTNKIQSNSAFKPPTLSINGAAARAEQSREVAKRNQTGFESADRTSHLPNGSKGNRTAEMTLNSGFAPPSGPRADRNNVSAGSKSQPVYTAQSAIRAFEAVRPYRPEQVLPASSHTPASQHRSGRSQDSGWPSRVSPAVAQQPATDSPWGASHSTLQKPSVSREESPKRDLLRKSPNGHSDTDSNSRWPSPASPGLADKDAPPAASTSIHPDRLKIQQAAQKEVQHPRPRREAPQKADDFPWSRVDRSKITLYNYASTSASGSSANAIPVTKRPSRAAEDDDDIVEIVMPQAKRARRDENDRVSANTQTSVQPNGRSYGSQREASRRLPATSAREPESSRKPSTAQISDSGWGDRAKLKRSADQSQAEVKSAAWGIQTGQDSKRTVPAEAPLTSRISSRMQDSSTPSSSHNGIKVQQNEDGTQAQQPRRRESRWGKTDNADAVSIPKTESTWPAEAPYNIASGMDTSKSLRDRLGPDPGSLSSRLSDPPANLATSHSAIKSGSEELAQTGELPRPDSHNRSGEVPKLSHALPAKPVNAMPGFSKSERESEWRRMGNRKPNQFPRR